jgi:hypothetical protein
MGLAKQREVVWFFKKVGNKSMMMTFTCRSSFHLFYGFKKRTTVYQFRRAYLDQTAMSLQ